jgi:hypothetical protein
MNGGRNVLPWLLGLVLGVAAGLFYAWRVSPVEYTDTAPAALRPDYRMDYLALIASAYAASGDLSRAQLRLSLFGDLPEADTLAALAQRRLGSGEAPSEARALAALAAALADRPTTPTSTRPPSTPTRTPTPLPTRRPSATPLPSATPGAPFSLVEREKVCDPGLPGPLIMVLVEDAAGQPVPGVEILVVWDDGQDRFYTGLKAELGLGYADFLMSPDTAYALQLAGEVLPFISLQPEPCLNPDGPSFPGSWMLRFQQPSE